MGKGLRWQLILRRYRITPVCTGKINTFIPNDNPTWNNPCMHRENKAFADTTGIQTE